MDHLANHKYCYIYILALCYTELLGEMLTLLGGLETRQ